MNFNRRQVRTLNLQLKSKSAVATVSRATLLLPRDRMCSVAISSLGRFNNYGWEGGYLKKLRFWDIQLDKGRVGWLSNDRQMCSVAISSFGGLITMGGREVIQRTWGFGKFNLTGREAGWLRNDLEAGRGKKQSMQEMVVWRNLVVL